MASSAAQTGGDPNKGGHVMLIGIVIQLLAILIYSILATDFLFNLKRNRSVRAAAPTENTFATSDPEKSDKIEGYGAGSGFVSREMKLMLFGLSFSTLCLFVRSIYRTAELRSVLPLIFLGGKVVVPDIHFSFSNGWTGEIIHTQVYFSTSPYYIHRAISSSYVPLKMFSMG